LIRMNQCIIVLLKGTQCSDLPMTVQKQPWRNSTPTFTVYFSCHFSGAVALSFFLSTLSFSLNPWNENAKGKKRNASGCK
jgi:hypothetical protein